MAQAYLIHQGLEEFAAAREQFSYLVRELQSAPVLGMQHGEVESLISREGTELLRRLLQGHLDLRSARENEREAVTGSDGVARSRCREGCERDLMSVFGEVQVRRRGYGGAWREQCVSTGCRAQSACGQVLPWSAPTGRARGGQGLV